MHGYSLIWHSEGGGLGETWRWRRSTRPQQGGDGEQDGAVEHRWVRKPVLPRRCRLFSGNRLFWGAAWLPGRLRLLVCQHFAGLEKGNAAVVEGGSTGCACVVCVAGK